MADARYKNGIFMGNGYRHKQSRQRLDSPLYHGWQPIMMYPDTNRRLWQLENADVKMRRVRLEDPNEVQADDWVVFFKNMAVASYSGPLDKITQDVRELLRKYLVSKETKE